MLVVLSHPLITLRNKWGIKMEEEVKLSLLEGAVKDLERDISRISELIRVMGESEDPKIITTIIDFFHTNEEYNLKARQILMSDSSKLVSFEVSPEGFDNISPYLDVTFLGGIKNSATELMNRFNEGGDSDVSVRKKTHPVITGEEPNEDTGSYMTSMGGGEFIQNKLMDKLSPLTEPSTPNDILNFLIEVKETISKLVQLEKAFESDPVILTGVESLILS